GEKTFVLLKRSFDAVPGVGRFTFAVGDAVEAIKNAAVMGRMNFWILIQATGDDPVAVWGEYMMENLVSPHTARGGGFIQALVMIGHDFSFTKEEIGSIARLI